MRACGCVRWMYVYLFMCGWEGRGARVYILG